LNNLPICKYYYREFFLPAFHVKMPDLQAILPDLLIFAGICCILPVFAGFLLIFTVNLKFN